jgi:hypothetical protein
LRELIISGVTILMKCVDELKVKGRHLKNSSILRNVKSQFKVKNNNSVGREGNQVNIRK